MASMMGGDFVEAYVLKNAYKEKLRRMEAAEAAGDGKKGVVVVAAAGSAGETKKAAASGGGSRGGGGGMFGFMKKKVHPKAAPAMETSSA
uniref:Uncharacterized protein n=1 Tax=Oryza punctata TaxID=4537 RepID=A0A0E0K1G8_ORYPU